MEMRLLLVCSLMAAAFCAGAQVDRAAYAPTTLRQAFAVTPTSPGAPYELDPDEPRLRIRAVWTGQRRRPGADLAPLLTAWLERRKGAKDAPTIDPRNLEKFAEIEINDHGRIHWMLVAHPAIQALTGVTPGLPGELYAHRVGFARGRTVLVVADLQFGPEVIESARYGSGQVRFVYAGKPYALAATRLTEETTGKPRAHPSRYQKLKDWQGGTFDSVVLDFGVPGPVEATLSMHVQGPGDHPAGDGAGRATVSLEVDLMLGRGVFVRVAGNAFAGCTLQLPQLEPAGVRGKIVCARPLPSGLSDFEFELAP